MNHVWTIAWLPTRYCVQSSKSTIDVIGLRRAFSILTKPSHINPRNHNGLFPKPTCIPSTVTRQSIPRSTRHFSITSVKLFQNANPAQKAVRGRAPSVLAFRRNDLRPSEVKAIFGHDGPPTPLANNLLKVLHSRRVNGTLDLDLPANLARQLKSYPRAVEDALHWLRLEYPVDEDAAILQRIEREEAGEGNEELIHRAENLGLYKPQSGHYGSKLGEEGDIYGESELQRMRKENEEKAEQEKQELDQYIEGKQQAAEEKAGGLEARKEDGLEGRQYSRCRRISC
jgi:rhomboid-like protein